MPEKPVRFECESCGAVFEKFLEDMADQNLKITCPQCGGEHDPSRQDESEPGAA